MHWHQQRRQSSFSILGGSFCSQHCSLLLHRLYWYSCLWLCVVSHITKVNEQLEVDRGPETLKSAFLLKPTYCATCSEAAAPRLLWVDIFAGCCWKEQSCSHLRCWHESSCDFAVGWRSSSFHFSSCWKLVVPFCVFFFPSRPVPWSGLMLGCLNASADKRERLRCEGWISFFLC